MREPQRGEGSRLSLLRGGRSRAGCRRGPRYRLDSPDNRTGGEGKDPGSGCVSTSSGAGDWREPGNSTKAPAAPRGAVHQGQAGTGLSLLPAVRQGASSGHPHPRLRTRQGERWGAECGRRDVREHRSSRFGAMAGRRRGGAAYGDVPPSTGAAGADSEARWSWGEATRNSRDRGSGGSNRRLADSAADLRSGPRTHSLWLSTRPDGAGGRPGSAPGVVCRAHGGDRRRRIELLRYDSPRGLIKVTGPTDQ